LPRIAVEVTSPDARYRAFVRNHASIDPPSQSLWITGERGEPNPVMRLAEDRDWCDSVVWSDDSRAVAFLVQGARLILVDAASRQVRVDRWLVDRRGYPPSHVVTGLSLGQHGSEARFTDCVRGTAVCVSRTERLDDR
jgi:hypothetical protein